MPVHIRNFYYNKLIDSKKKEKEAAEQSSNSSKSVLPKMASMPKSKVRMK